MKHHDSTIDSLPQHRSRRTPRQPIGLNVTAMIDVVFLLLIYFLAVTNFKLGEEVFRLDLPERGQQQVADPFQLDEQPLRIMVSSTTTPPAGYQLRLEGPYDQPANFQQLYEFLSQQQITGSSAIGLFAPDHPIVIQPDATAQWEHAIGAFNAAARARYTNITFAGPTS
jgi:biopolymer transport protein ExbD